MITTLLLNAKCSAQLLNVDKAHKAMKNKYFNSKTVLLENLWSTDNLEIKQKQSTQI